MKSTTTAGQSLAIAAFVAFAGGALYILLEKAILSGTWSMQHVLTVLIVFGTVASGHLSKDAWCGKRRLASLGFAVLFIAGTGLVVYNSVGRQAATSTTQANEAVSHNELLDAIRERLIDERDGLKKANAKRDWEMAGRPDKHGNRTTRPICGKGCIGWKTIASEHRAQIAALEAQLAKLGPSKTVAAQARAQQFADVAAIFGADKSDTIAVLTLLEPFFVTLFFEVGIIVSAGFAFRGAAIPVANDNGPVPQPFPLRKPFPATVASDHPVVAALRTGPASSNDELAHRMGVTKGEATKRRQEVEHLLDVETVGRCKRIRLVG